MQNNFTKSRGDWMYSPQIYISPQFFGHPAETPGSKESNPAYVALFHVLLPPGWVPLDAETPTVGEIQGILHAQKHAAVGRISTTWVFYEVLDLCLRLRKSEPLYDAFEASDYLARTRAISLKGVAKAAKEMIVKDKLGIADLLKSIAKEGFFKWWP